ncbi:MAG TPA: helix-turn-helix domain-containing protein [Acidobacteriota bacterium]|nr:helix-turn-helix domain-containing protein [Acidobacteriota bacterium]
MSQENLNGTESILTENELCELLGMKKSALAELRYKQKFPFCRISNTVRIYQVKDVLEFIADKRTVLDRDSD